MYIQYIIQVTLLEERMLVKGGANKLESAKPNMGKNQGRGNTYFRSGILNIAPNIVEYIVLNLFLECEIRIFLIS